MKAPIGWLKDFTDIDVSPKELADAMTLSGSKVEEITYISQPLDVALVLDRSSSMNNYSVTVNIEESRSEQLTGADMRLGQDYIVTAANGNEYLVKGFKSYTYEDVYTPSTKTWKRSDFFSYRLQLFPILFLQIFLFLQHFR